MRSTKDDQEGRPGPHKTEVSEELIVVRGLTQVLDHVRRDKNSREKEELSAIRRKVQASSLLGALGIIRTASSDLVKLGASEPENLSGQKISLHPEGGSYQRSENGRCDRVLLTTIDYKR